MCAIFRKWNLSTNYQHLTWPFSISTITGVLPFRFRFDYGNFVVAKDRWKFPFFRSLSPSPTVCLPCIVRRSLRIRMAPLGEMDANLPLHNLLHCLHAFTDAATAAAATERNIRYAKSRIWIMATWLCLNCIPAYICAMRRLVSVACKLQLLCSYGSSNATSLSAGRILNEIFVTKCKWGTVLCYHISTPLMWRSMHELRKSIQGKTYFSCPKPWQTALKSWWNIIPATIAFGRWGKNDGRK